MKSHFAITCFVALVVLQGATIGAPIPNPKPIEDILNNQLPDPGTFMPAVAADSSIVPALLASGFDPNDTSALGGKH